MHIRDRRILGVLLTDSRVSLKQLAEQVGLLFPSMPEHLCRLEERDVIRHYTVGIDPVSLGYVLQATVRVWPMPGKLHIVQQLIKETPEIDECDKATGEDCSIARLYVHLIDQLDEILDRMAYHAETNTVIVKAQLVE